MGGQLLGVLQGSVEKDIKNKKRDRQAYKIQCLHISNKQGNPGMMIAWLGNPMKWG
jgi:hypothetical protein